MCNGFIPACIVNDDKIGLKYDNKTAPPFTFNIFSIFLISLSHLNSETIHPLKYIEFFNFFELLSISPTVKTNFTNAMFSLSDKKVCTLTLRGISSSQDISLFISNDIFSICGFLN